MTQGTNVGLVDEMIEFEVERAESRYRENVARLLVSSDIIHGQSEIERRLRVMGKSFRARLEQIASVYQFDPITGRRQGEPHRISDLAQHRLHLKQRTREHQVTVGDDAPYLYGALARALGKPHPDAARASKVQYHEVRTYPSAAEVPYGVRFASAAGGPRQWERKPGYYLAYQTKNDAMPDIWPSTPVDAHAPFVAV